MIWLVMFVGGIFTFGTRFVMLSGWVAHGLPRWLIDALAFVPIAVLTAILLPAVLIDPATQQIIVIGNKRIVAAVVATIIALLTRNVIATISSGLATLWLVQWWLLVAVGLVILCLGGLMSDLNLWRSHHFFAPALDQGWSPHQLHALSI